jgi:hypothetical protein
VREKVSLPGRRIIISKWRRKSQNRKSRAEYQNASCGQARAKIENNGVEYQNINCEQERP